MKWLVYSDVHGNLPAFEAIIKDCVYYDASISLGDLVNYGPWGNECIDLALSLKNPVLIMGNHETAFLNGFYPGDNELVKQFFGKTFYGFKKSEEVKLFLPEFVFNEITFTHTIGDKTIYPDTTIGLERNYVIGHSHHQFHYRNNQYFLVNAGSVGQNRKTIDLANYLIYDDESGQFDLRVVPYDFGKIINEMKVRNYPEECIGYYLNKPKFQP